MKNILLVLVFLGLNGFETFMYAQSHNETLNYFPTFSADVGNIQMVHSSEAVVSGKNSVPAEFHLNELRDINKMQAGKKTIKGALIGTGTGGLAGGIIGAAGYKECKEEGFMACFMRSTSRGDAFLTGALVGGLLGGITGIIIGAISDSRKSTKPPVTITWQSTQTRPNPTRLTPVVSYKLRLK